MRNVSIRELHEHTDEVISRVEMGEHIEITRDDVRIAIIEPARLLELGIPINSGELRPARGRLP
jgi:antitoxin (DNA-binding transcriptional repressor) of toxin-antitoxin stability system